ncbi:MAG: cardiolipin synthase [Lachnospiraceae bacterium]|nr:cardiolipin synthase [Lachnospiraceae bacterium]
MKKIFGRILVVVPALFLQIVWYVLLFGGLDRFMKGHLKDLLNTVFTILAVVFVLYLVSKRDEGSYKLVWVIVILVLPILGSVIYLFMGNKRSGRGLKKRLEKSAQALSMKDIVGSENYIEEVRHTDLRLSQSFEHICKTTGFPVFPNDTSRFYSFGEEMFADMCEDLKTAEKYIFIEYFIIQQGKFWDTLTEILTERAAAGVDVFVMYDDLGCIAKYSFADIHKLRQKGIRCVPFNPLLFVTTQLNNRDHRKLTVIDGRIAYSGGVNLADEYINEIHPYGVWKDIGFRITGPAVRSYAYMFLEFWNAFSKDPVLKEHITFPEQSTAVKNSENGYILPYYDSPMREEHTTNVLVSEILSLSTDYVWYYNPYLMLGDSLFDAFIRAAERGVDVRIIMPGVSDSKLVHRISRSYYKDLLKAGVKIYEYSPGFVHAKAFVADDKLAAIGTVNLDYRSLFLHFECESLFYKADIVEVLKEDYLKTLEKCKEMTPDNISNSVFHRLTDSILRLAAPLM